MFANLVARRFLNSGRVQLFAHDLAQGLRPAGSNALSL